jgi:hypothetical protein
VSFEETVNELTDEFDEYDGREFETEVRESLADEGYDTRFLQDFQHDGRVANYFRVEADEGEYRIEIVQEPDTDVKVYSTPEE